MLDRQTDRQTDRQGDEFVNRKYYLDFLRVISCIAVILLHVSVQNLNEISVNSFEWKVMNVFRCISSFGVPVFVMISGALFLSRKNSIKRIYSKNIKRIIFAFLFWSFILYICFYLWIKE